MPRHRSVPWLVLGVLFVLAPRAGAQTREEAADWLDALHDEVAGDLRGGRPLVVQAHVPLCSNQIIWCGNARLGDGDAPDKNLYWATSGGFRGWFGRRRSGWEQVYRGDGDGDVLEVRVWRRTVGPGRTWRARGVKERFSVYLVAFAWRGTAIRSAMDAYVADLHGRGAREIVLADGTAIRAGGAAHVVAYVGHNGWMDVAAYDFEAAAGAGRSRGPKGSIALACLTEDYLAEPLAAKERVPLLLTRSLLFAGAHAFEGAVTAFARGRSLAEIRRAAARNYARGQNKALGRVSGMFTNPAHSRWKKRRK